MFNARLSEMTDYPFTRLAGLLGKIPPLAGRPPLNLAVGEPQMQPPRMIADCLARHVADWGRYPPIAGTPDFRAAVASWLTRRYNLRPGAIDADRAILPVQGTREALFQIATVAAADVGRDDAAVLFPNTSYAIWRRPRPCRFRQRERMGSCPIWTGSIPNCWRERRCFICAAPPIQKVRSPISII
jgi:aspartate/methionine/tyrosine aminotransferase